MKLFLLFKKTVDSITDHGLCYEGGIQSFQQICNLLSRKVSVEVLLDLRDEQRRNTFSAAGYLVFLRNNILNSEVPVTAAVVENLTEEYLLQYPLDNKRNQERELRWKVAFKDFKENELWKKLDLVVEVPE